MTAIDYARFDTRRLGELLEHWKRTEKDFALRLEGRLKKHRLTSRTNGAPVPDPVAKRLGFLLDDTRARRRALERELAMRPYDASRPHSDTLSNMESAKTSSLPRQSDMHLEAGRSTRPGHSEWLIDEAIRDSFPASDPASTSQPGSIVSERYAESVE